MSKLFDIVQQAMDYRQYVYYLRKRSPRFPHIIMEGRMNIKDEEEECTVFLSTLVVFEFDKRKFIRHHVEAYLFKGEIVNLEQLIQKMKESCLATIEDGVPFIQIDERGIHVGDEEITQ